MHVLGEVTVLLDLVLLHLVCCAHTSEDELDIWEGANVSTQVASQASSLTFGQGTMVILSGRLPSAQVDPAEKQWTIPCAKCHLAWHGRSGNQC